MALMISYDIPSKHIDMKKKLMADGFQDYIPHDGKKVWLPNTTLYAPKGVVADGYKAMQEAAAELSVKLERAICVDYSAWTASWGDPHK